MNDVRRSLACLVAFLGMASLTPAARAQAPIRYQQFSAWIGRFHPNILSGDPRVNAVLIVVDTNSQYVASVADSLSADVLAAIDSAYASVGARNAVQGMAADLVAGRLRLPDSTSAPVYVVDGKRVSRVDSLDVHSIEDIRFENGTVIVRMTHGERWQHLIDASHRERVRRLGIPAEDIDFGNVQMTQHGPGIIGPHTLNVTILRRKGQQQ